MPADGRTVAMVLLLLAVVAVMRLVMIQSLPRSPLDPNAGVQGVHHGRGAASRQHHSREARHHHLTGASHSTGALVAPLPPGFLAQRMVARSRQHVDPKAYLLPPEPHDMRKQHEQVRAYIGSDTFRALLELHRSNARSSSGGGSGRGIIINAGGSRLLSSAVVTLKVLREVHHCMLPVELVWHGPEEMDAATLAFLASTFAPLRGYHLGATPFPPHQRQVARVGWVGKVFSLLGSRFQEVLLLDADSIPLQNPEDLFEEPDYQQHGNLFWPDFWSPSREQREQVDILFDMVGLKTEVVAPVLDKGKGGLIRGTESGQLLLHLGLHADVAEYAAWINSFGDAGVYKSTWGDKDTWAPAFAAAGKAHAFMQVQVPPGAALTWREGALLVKASQQHAPGWQLAGMLQFDARGAPAFLHRTMDKMWAGAAPWHLGVLTGPLPYRWVRYYLALDALGPTTGVPSSYAVPDAALQHWRLNPLPAPRAAAAGAQWRLEGDAGCPLAAYLDYLSMRRMGLPLGPQPWLDATCSGALAALTGSVAAAREAAQHPECANLAAVESRGAHAVPAAAAGGGVRSGRRRGGRRGGGGIGGGDGGGEHSGVSGFDELALVQPVNPLEAAVEVGDGSPVPAWSPGDYWSEVAAGNSSSSSGSGSGSGDGSGSGSQSGGSPEPAVLALLRAAQRAFDWLQQHLDELPVIRDGAAGRQPPAASAAVAGSNASSAGSDGGVKQPGPVSALPPATTPA